MVIAFDYIAGNRKVKAEIGTEVSAKKGARASSPQVVRDWLMSTGRPWSLTVLLGFTVESIFHVLGSLFAVVSTLEYLILWNQWSLLEVCRIVSSLALPSVGWSQMMLALLPTQWRRFVEEWWWPLAKLSNTRASLTPLLKSWRMRVSSLSSRVLMLTFFVQLLMQACLLVMTSCRRCDYISDQIKTNIPGRLPA